MAKADFEKGEGEEEGLEGHGIMPAVFNVRVKYLAHMVLFGGGGYGTLPTPGSGFSLEDVGNKQWYVEDYIWSPTPSSPSPACYEVGNLLLYPQSPTVMMTAGP